jgi:hypothetical protein
MGDTGTKAELFSVAARYVLGLADGEYLVAVADRALSEGIYSPALHELWQQSTPEMPELRGVARTAMREVRPLFEQALRELGLGLPSRAEAAWLLSRQVMKQIVGSQGSPREALCLLHDVVDASRSDLPDRRFVGDALDLAGLMGIFWSYREPHYNCSVPAGRLVTNEDELAMLLDRHAREEALAWMQRHP